MLHFLRHFAAGGALLLVSLSPLRDAAAEGKIDVMAGAFNLTSTGSSGGDSSLSNLGVYALDFRQTFLPHVEYQLGYSIITSKLTGGDLGFGPDLGLLYFPVTTAAPTSAKSENVQLTIDNQFKPYIGSAFHQRQYQSTQSTYAGFSFIFGNEYLLNESRSLRTELRYIRLIGPSNAAANEIDLLVGLTIHVGR